MKVMGVDPGPEESHLAYWDGIHVLYSRSYTNIDMLHILSMVEDDCLVAIEYITTMTFRVPQTVMDTAVWVGQFIYASRHRGPYTIKRLDIKKHICGRGNAKDTDIRNAIVGDLGELWSWQDMIRDGEIVRKKSGRFKGEPKKERLLNPAYCEPVSGDQWQALAVAKTVYDLIKNGGELRRWHH